MRRLKSVWSAPSKHRRPETRNEVPMKRVVPQLVIAILLIACAASAQVVTGTIIGAVKDPSQAALPGVTATITSPSLPGGPMSTVTGSTGEYRFAAVPPGVYALTLSLQGFATYQEQGLR